MTVLALTWFRHRRTTELCAGLGIELIEFTTSRRSVARYLSLGWRTFLLLVRRRPKTLMVQNPSLVLAAFALLLRPIFRYRLIVDAHNEAVQPYINRQRWIVQVAHWVLRNADRTIVTNSYLGEVVERVGGRYFVLPDRIPAVPEGPTMTLPPGFNVALIATFAADEPIPEIFQAVAGQNVNLLVTGNSMKLDPRLRAMAPENVRFMGFLPDNEYWRLLRSVDAVVDLTTMDNCLVCGAYEAIAIGKPVLLSENAASRELFGECAVFAASTVEGIREGVEALREQQASLVHRIPAGRAALQSDWDEQAKVLQAKFF